MKRLLIVSALALLTAASTGCGSCGGCNTCGEGCGSCGGGWSGFGLFNMFRRGGCDCERCETCHPCGCGCDGDETIIEEGPSHCNCHHSGDYMPGPTGAPSLGTPSMTPDTYSFIPRK